MGRDTCWGEGGRYNQARAQLYLGAGTPSSCFQEPQRRPPLLTTGCNLPATTGRATEPHAPARNVRLTPRHSFSSLHLRPHVPEVFWLCIRGQLSATESLCWQGSTRPTRGEPRPRSHGMDTGTPAPADSRSCPGLRPSQRPDLSNHFPFWQWEPRPLCLLPSACGMARSECQRPVRGTSSVSPAHACKRPQESCFRAFF